MPAAHHADSQTVDSNGATIVIVTIHLYGALNYLGLVHDSAALLLPFEPPCTHPRLSYVPAAGCALPAAFGLLLLLQEKAKWLPPWIFSCSKPLPNAAQ